MSATLKNYLPWLVAIAACFLLQPILESTLSAYVMTIIMYAGINVILAVSLNLVNGFTGQFSIGHAGFMAIGGYLSAYMTTELAKVLPQVESNVFLQQVIFIGCLLCGGIAAAIFGFALGQPSLRLKGDYLAIVTLGFGEIIRVVLLNTEAVGGARGYAGILPWTSFGWVACWGTITVFTVLRLIDSPYGRRFLAVREDEIAAEAVGVNTTRAKVRSFMIGAFFAGIAGGLFAHYLRYLNPSTFDFNRSFEVIIMVVLGGMGSVTGSVVAAVFLTILKEALRPLQDLTQIDFRMVIYAAVLVAMMLLRPQGIFGKKEISDFFRKRSSS